jgi:DNA-binding NarL/FixJ family response regulator
MKNYTVVIVEDHTLLSQAISGIVNQFKSFEVLYLCKNGDELVKKLHLNHVVPDIVLMDVNMPIMNGIETTKWLATNYPFVNVLALTVEEDENVILNMIRSGAKGYLLKDVDKETLEMALLRIMEEGSYHSNTVTNALINSLKGSYNQVVLKEREIDFLKYICTEKTYKEIADEMNLSPKTIDGYRDSLFVKLNVKNRIGLVLYAIKQKIFVQ